MRGKTPPLFHGDDIAPAPLRWPSSAGTRPPSHSLPDASPNGRASHSLDNIAACAHSFGNLASPLGSGTEPNLALSCADPRNATGCLPDKQNNLVHGRRQTRSAEGGSVYSFRWAHFPTSCFPENRSLARPSSRYCPVWYSRHRPPSVAAFSSDELAHVPPLAITARCRWLPASPTLPQSVPAPHRWKSARCS